MTLARTFTTSRRVRVTDCDENSRIRVDAIARYLQDIGYDDTDDIGVGDGGSWVARSIEIETINRNSLPTRNEIVQLSTSCSGVGKAFAQRFVEIQNGDQVVLQAKTIWVCVNEVGKPTAIPEWLKQAYPQAEKIKPSNVLAGAYEKTDSFIFQTRANDVDVNSHINNSVVFQIANEVANKLSISFPSKMRVEYYLPFDSGQEVNIHYSKLTDGFNAWVIVKEKLIAAINWTV